MLRRVIDDQLWTDIQFAALLGGVPLECFENLVRRKDNVESQKTRNLKTAEAEAYVLSRLARFKFPASKTVDDVAYDIHNTWDKSKAEIRSPLRR